MLAIASHITQSQVGVDYFQVTHPEQLFKECSSYAELASTAEQAPRVLMSAIQHAYSLHDVGVIVLPGDVADARRRPKTWCIHPPLPGKQWFRTMNPWHAWPRCSLHTTALLSSAGAAAPERNARWCSSPPA